MNDNTPPVMVVDLMANRGFSRSEHQQMKAATEAWCATVQELISTTKAASPVDYEGRGERQIWNEVGEWLVGQHFDQLQALNIHDHIDHEGKDIREHNKHLQVDIKELVGRVRRMEPISGFSQLLIDYWGIDAHSELAQKLLINESAALHVQADVQAVADVREDEKMELPPDTPEERHVGVLNGIERQRHVAALARATEGKGDPYKRFTDILAGVRGTGTGQEL